LERLLALCYRDGYGELPIVSQGGIAMRRLPLYSLFFLFLTLPVTSSTQAEEEVMIPYAVGYFEEDDEIADRDNDIPSLYDRNKWELMRQRDRSLLRHGKCCPPPEVIVSPGITVPNPRNGRFYKYDPRNPRYRDAR
jgi:hypothetical protein